MGLRTNGVEHIMFEGVRRVRMIDWSCHGLLQASLARLCSQMSLLKHATQVTWIVVTAMTKQ